MAATKPELRKIKKFIEEEQMVTSIVLTLDKEEARTLLSLLGNNVGGLKSGTYREHTEAIYSALVPYVEPGWVPRFAGALTAKTKTN